MYESLSREECVVPNCSSEVPRLHGRAQQYHRVNNSLPTLGLAWMEGRARASAHPVSPPCSGSLAPVQVVPVGETTPAVEESAMPPSALELKSIEESLWRQQQSEIKAEVHTYITPTASV